MKQDWLDDGICGSGRSNRESNASRQRGVGKEEAKTRKVSGSPGSPTIPDRFDSVRLTIVSRPKCDILLCRCVDEHPLVRTVALLTTCERLLVQGSFCRTTLDWPSSLPHCMGPEPERDLSVRYVSHLRLAQARMSVPTNIQPRFQEPSLL